MPVLSFNIEHPTNTSQTLAEEIKIISLNGPLDHGVPRFNTRVDMLDDGAYTMNAVVVLSKRDFLLLSLLGAIHIFDFHVM